MSLVGCSNQGTPELVILAMGPFQDSMRSPDWPGGPALIPAARQAVHDINNRSDILHGFTLKLLEGESGCEFVDKSRVSFTSVVFHHNLSSQIVGMVGPGCSASAIALSKLISHSEVNLMQISIASTPDINAGSSSEFRNSFRTVGSSLVYVDAFSKLIKKAGWVKVGAVYDSLRPFHISTYNAFRKEIGDEVHLNFTFALTGSKFKSLATDIAEKCIRVVFVFAGTDSARKVLCSAYKNKVTYPNVQFIFIERVREDFIAKKVHINSTNQTCSTVEMEHALNGMILTNNRLYRSDVNSTITEAGISYNQFNKTYQSYLDSYLEQRGINRSSIPKTAPHYSSGYYDAVWALALALNRTANLSHAPRDLGNNVRENLKSLYFEGMSGAISFDDNRRDVPTIGAVLSQCSQNECVTAGTFTNGTLVFEGTMISDDVRIIMHEVPLPLGITVIVAAMVMAVLLVFLQMMFCRCSHVKEVKATSPHLNHLIFSGCYLFITALLVFTVQETFTTLLSEQPVAYGVLCSTKYWVFSLGFTLIFSTVASKTWRIYRIFNHFKQGRVHFVSDEILVLFITFLVSIDVALLTAWNVIDPWRPSVRTISKQGSLRQEQMLCTCDHFVEWASALFLYKGFVVLLLVILSILVRQVKKKSFKSTKRVIVLIYILVINFFIGFALYAVFLFLIPILSFLSLALCLIVAVVIISFSLFLSILWPVVVDEVLPDTTKSPSHINQPGTLLRVPVRNSKYYNDYYQQKLASPTQ